MTSQATHGCHIVHVYLEDTDFSGVVYHSNYVNYFERAREHLLNPTLLVELWDNEGVGFTVTKVELNYKEGARYGDVLEIRTTPILSSKYRISFDQQVWKQGGDKALVKGMVEMVCLNKEGKLVEVPKQIQHDLNASKNMNESITNHNPNAIGRQCQTELQSSCSLNKLYLIKTEWNEHVWSPSSMMEDMFLKAQSAL